MLKKFFYTKNLNYKTRVTAMVLYKYWCKTVDNKKALTPESLATEGIKANIFNYMVTHEFFCVCQ